MLSFLRSTGDGLARVSRLPAACLALAWMGLLWHLSSGEAPELPIGLPWSFLFNLGHAPLFGVLGLLVALVLPRAAERGDWPLLGARQFGRLAGPG